MCAPLLFLLVGALPGSGASQPCAQDAPRKEPPGIRFQYFPSAVPESPCAEHALLLVWPEERPEEGSPDDPPAAELVAVPDFDPSLWSSSLDIRPIVAQGPAGFDWHAAFRESFLFLAIEHSYRVKSRNTRARFQGPFFKDWFRSASSVRGWRDGNNFLTNYIGHPMQGAVTGYIQIQNDPRGRNLTFAANKDYFKSRSKAMLWAAVYGAQFELGPLGEAALGNVGMETVPKRYSRMATVDLVVTPTVGAAWLVGEDALDRYFISKVEGRTENRVARVILRSLFNPSRSFANLMRGRWPWHRDTRAANP